LPFNVKRVTEDTFQAMPIVTIIRQQKQIIKNTFRFFILKQRKNFLNKAIPSSATINAITPTKIEDLMLSNTATTKNGVPFRIDFTINTIPYIRAITLFVVMLAR
jgi:hypothetical protein